MCEAATNESIDFYPNILPRPSISGFGVSLLELFGDFVLLASAVNDWNYWVFKISSSGQVYGSVAAAIGLIVLGFPNKHARSGAELITHDLVKCADVKRPQYRHDEGDQR
jgi:hypothetical protein